MTDVSAPGQCTVSGGDESTQAKFTDMRSAAGRLDSSGNEAGSLLRGVLGIASSLPEKSALLSPGSAFQVAEKITALTISLGKLELGMEFVARTLRWSAIAYEFADVTQRNLLAGINVATAPVRLAADAQLAIQTAMIKHPPLFLADPTPHPDEMREGFKKWFGDVSGSVTEKLDEDVRADPSLADGLVPWVQGTIDAFGPTVGSTMHIAPPPPDFEGQVGWLLAAGRSMGFFHDTKPLSVKETSARTGPATKRKLADLVQRAADVEHRSGDDKSVLSVRRVVGADGKGAWVVAIPGTTHWPLKSDHGPSDTAANLESMAGTKSSLYPAIDKALGAAMREAGVTPGSEPVLALGHSQGGIVAARLAADDHFRTKYNLTEVVTAGSPIDRITIPQDVNVLSIEDNHDIIPHADGVDTPDAMNRVDVTCEPPRGSKLHSLGDAHDANRYARNASELTPDRGGQLAEWYSRNRKFLDGRDTTFEFDLRRP